MSPPRLTKPIVRAVWLIVAIAGLLAGWLGRRNAATEILNDLAADAQRSAVAIDPLIVRQLAGAPVDASTPAFAALRKKLIALQAVNSRARLVYLLRAELEKGRIVFLADSAPLGSKAAAEPGTEFPGAAQRPGLQASARTGWPMTDGPTTTSFGTWLTAYAPIGDASGEKNMAPSRELLGLDLADSEWTAEIWGAAARQAGAVWLLLGLPFAAWLIVRRQHEQREAIRNLSEAMEQSHSALMIVDLDSVIEYANRGLVHQIGYSRRELIGRNWREFQVADTPPERLAEMVSTVRSGHPWEGEWCNRRKDGTVYPVRGVVTPVHDRTGRLACFVAVFDDMTELKRQEAELREARDLAQAGDRAKGQFLATMSHEVRTPLNGIIGFTHLLLNTPLTAEQRDYVDTIRKGGEALMQLTGDILDYARIETGKLKLDLAPCDPRECVEEALDLLADAASAKKLNLLHWIDDDVPAAIFADSGRVRQVLVNFLSNAVKFTETGEIEVRVALARDGEAGDGRQTEVEGGRPEAGGIKSPDTISPPASGLIPPTSEKTSVKLVFSVRDTGVGIALGDGTKLFKPFTQIDSSSTRKHGGTGLGLAISRDLVRLMGGEITLASAPGQGATFSFTLRAKVAQPAVPPPSLDGLRLALVAPPGSLRSEVVRLAARWRTPCVECDGLAALPPATAWDLALVAVDEALARTLAASAMPEFPAAKAFGLVPVTLSTELRTALRAHFRLLVNYPLHHAPLFALLRGLRPLAPVAAPPPRHFGLHVLLVEDNATNQRLMQKILANLGCTCAVVVNGRLALEELARDGAAYDFVLLDLHMPELDGIATIEEIRAGRAGARVQSIWVSALTADARDEQKTRARAAGINDYLVKPVRLPDLEAAFERYRAARGPRE